LLNKNYIKLFLFSLAAVMMLSSCAKRLGWGVLLWSTESPPIFSGTVLPVYIRSNIDQVWVVGIPEYLSKGKTYPEKLEIPLSQLEFSGSRKRAVHRAQAFSEYSHLYAENLQDGLPIRESADNNARRVYRLRVGEIIKILDKVSGSPPISTTGDPLPGDWYKVLTLDGTIGYCFSYRLKIFRHNEGPVRPDAVVRVENTVDPDLDIIMSQTWSPEYYLAMINSNRVNINELEKKYHFDPGHDTGIAKIVHPDVEIEIHYTGITGDGERAWSFDGTNLQMNLRTNTTLAVQFLESTGLRRTLIFVALPSDIEDLIAQENARRESQYMSIYNQGPVFTSNNYGTITFTASASFLWTGFDLLVPHTIPNNVKGEGNVSMDLFISQSFEDRYNGAFTFYFSDKSTIVRFMYYFDNQGMRLEVLPDFAVDDVTVTRRASTPMVLYFFRDTTF
jgi:hypothetical protein